MVQWKIGVNIHVRYVWKRDYKLLVDNDVGISNLLTPVQNYTEHAVITRGSIGYILHYKKYLNLMSGVSIYFIWKPKR